MKLFILKRLVTDNMLFCDVWVAKTEEEVKKKAVDSVMSEWYFSFTEDEQQNVSCDEIYKAYIDYWQDEELWQLSEDTL
jgi:hypothetical protein